MADSSRARRRKSQQGVLPFRFRGGPRCGAGRKPVGERAGVSHRTRSPLAARFPVHVTLKLKSGLPSLRREAEYAALRAAFAAGCSRDGFRLVQYSVQRDHLHLMVEARGREALSRGMQGLTIRIARGLNRLWSRTGKVFADRFHDRILKTPREVRRVLAYLLHNAKKHGLRLAQGLDQFTSAAWFDGWKEAIEFVGAMLREQPVAIARTWLLAVGWRRHGCWRWGGDATA